MKVEEIEIPKIRPYEFNNRKHDATQVERIARSIKEFGFNQPIVIDEENVILVGHGRLFAAQKLGLRTAPVIKLGNLTETQKKAYRILDNKLQNDSTWDFNNLELELGFLEDSGLDLSAWGLNELKNLLDCPADSVCEDAGPGEVPDESYVKEGDIIELGQHRVMCGDSGKIEQLKELLGGAAPSLVFTDPPYGVAIGKKNRFLNSIQKSGRNLRDIESDDLDPESLKAVLLPAFKNLRSVMADDCTVFVTAPQGGELGMMMMMMMQDAGLGVRHVLIWKKNQPTFSMGRLDYDYQHEPILLTWGKRHKRPMKGEHRTSVWEIDRPRLSKEHPTMKPVALVANAMLNNSDVGDACLDIFLGSGTSLIAADQLGRVCYGMEIAPHYCQVILERYEKHCQQTGKPFVCKINGASFLPPIKKDDGEAK